MAAVPSIGRADAVGRHVASPEAATTRLLYERYYDRVYGYCLYQLGSREEAEDAAQTTFLYAFIGLRRGVVPDFEARWLFTIARNACIARYRARGRRQAEVLHDPQTLQDVLAAPDQSGDELIRLEEALAVMPEQQRRAILLREWQGLSYREIAEEMGLGLAAVEALIFRARRSLAQLLNGETETRPKRRLARALDLGSLATALKSVLAGGSAAKVAATAAALATAVLLAGGAPRQDGERSPAERERPLPAVTSLSTDRVEQTEIKTLLADAAATRSSKADPSARDEPPASQPLGSAQDEGGPSPGGSTGAVTAAAGSTVEDAVDVVERGAGSLGVDLPPAPELPGTGLPDEPLPELPGLQLPELPQLDASEPALSLP